MSNEIGMKREPQLTWSWPECDEMSDMPTARSGHSFCIVTVEMGKDEAPRQFGYLFGGVKARSNPAGPCNELYRFDIDNMLWENLGIVGSVSARWQHTATVWKNSMILFGGTSNKTNTRFFSDVHVLDTATDSWKEMGPGPKWPNCPVPRASHASCIVDGMSDIAKFYVFGGYGGRKGSRRDFDDLSVLDLATEQWRTIEGNGDIPPRRSGHQLCAIPSYLYVCGGWNAGDQFNDVYLFDLNQEFWSRVERCRYRQHRRVSKRAGKHTAGHLGPSQIGRPAQTKKQPEGCFFYS